MKVLVVEDEHKIATSIKKGLEQEGWIVDLAFDGIEGYDLSSTEEYDAIILDLMLPKKSGIEVCTDLRSDGVHTPILMLTALGEIEDKVNGLDIGADDYLTKPFAFTELVARIRAISRRKNEVKKDIITVGPISLDSKSATFKKNGKDVILSKKEFALMEYLMKNSNRVASKDDIISHVWSYESDILPNTVEVFVRYLRKKLGQDIIKTVRGFGYKIGY